VLQPEEQKINAKLLTATILLTATVVFTGGLSIAVTLRWRDCARTAAEHEHAILELRDEVRRSHQRIQQMMATNSVKAAVGASGGKTEISSGAR
jgi:hypothetical protein